MIDLSPISKVLSVENVQIIFQSTFSIFKCSINCVNLSVNYGLLESPTIYENYYIETQTSDFANSIS